MSLASEQPDLARRFDFFKRAGIDRPVALTIAGRLTQGVATFLSLLLIARLLNAFEQGYYFTFSSLLSLQVFFELGLSQVVLHAASHEVAHLSLTDEGVYEGDPVGLRKLADLFQASARWYVAMSILLVALLIPLGLGFFASETHSAVVTWRTPWCLASIFTSATMLTTAVTCFVEGCGEVSDVAGLRLAQSLVGNIVLWSVMLAHGGLYCMAGYLIAQFAAACWWLIARHGPKLKALAQMTAVRGAMAWRESIWPFQWRMGLSWLSGYLIFQLFNPILFHYRGAVEAGQFGITLSALMGISGICMAWINTKVPKFGTLIARREFDQLDDLFFRSAKQVVILSAILSAAFWALIEAFKQFRPDIGARFAGEATTGALVVATVFVSATFAMASYLRSHKREPFLALSVAVGLGNTILALVCGPRFGALGIAVGYLLISGVIGFTWGAIIFAAKRHEWHAQPVSA